MDIFCYSDESGVFDRIHNDFFVFGGIILFGKEEKDKWTRLYSAAESRIRQAHHYPKEFELKATHLSNKDKAHLYRSLNQCRKFCVIINQKRILETIFNDKKTKQRYLDYAFKMAVKNALLEYLKNDPQQIDNMHFFVDEHTTATDGRYELQETLLREFKYGIHNLQYDRFFPPIFPELKNLDLRYCNSASTVLVRAADIIANKVYYHTVQGEREKLNNLQNLHIHYLP